MSLSEALKLHSRIIKSFPKKESILGERRTYGSWLTCHWLMKTHVSLGMKNPLIDVFFVVLQKEAYINKFYVSAPLHARSLIF